MEVRADDDEAWQAVLPLEHLPSHLMAAAERAVLATLEAGCSARSSSLRVWKRPHGANNFCWSIRHGRNKTVGGHCESDVPARVC